MKVDISHKSSVYNKQVIRRARKNLKRAAFVALLVAVLATQTLFPVSVAHAVVPVESGSGLARKITAVSSLVQSIAQTATQIALKLKEFVGDSLANAIAKAALRSITQSTVNWINSGFKGSPAFITNPEGFLTDVADQVIGAAIESAAPLLCAPFQLDLRLALGLNYSFGASREIRCRLTDVIANVQGSYQGFVAGDFRQGGWDRFINIAGVPQNNPYGAYLATQDYLGIRVVSATGQASKRLEFGRGFLDWRECEVPGDPIPIPKSSPPRTRQGPCKKKGPVKTPGSVIEGQLQSALNVDLSGLAIADEINEVFAALINQLIKTVISPRGLAGASNYNASFDQGPAVISGTTIRARDIADLNSKATRLGAIERQEPGAGDAGVAFGTALVNPGAAGGEIARIKTEEAREVGAQGTSGNIVGADQNLAGSDNGIPKRTRQSSIFSWNTTDGCLKAGVTDTTYYGPNKAVDGNPDGRMAGVHYDSCSFPGSNIVTNSENQPWWEIDLGKAYPIGRILMYPRKDGWPDSAATDPISYLANTYMFVSAQPFSGSRPDTAFDSDGVKIEIPTPVPDPIILDLSAKQKTGQYVQIQKRGGGRLSFSEIQIFQDRLTSISVPQVTHLTADFTELGRQTTKSVVPLTAGTIIGQNWQTAYSKYESAKGVDGQISGNFYDSSASLVGVVHPTATNPYFHNEINLPWWQVDLGSKNNIGEIHIWPRTDIATADTLSAAYVFITDASYTGGEAPPWHEGIKILPHAGSPEWRPIVIPANKDGRYVRIQRNTKGPALWFSEVQVFTRWQQASPPAGQTPPVATQTFTLSPEAATAIERPPASRGTAPYQAQQAQTEFRIKNVTTQPQQTTLKTVIAESGEEGKLPFGERFTDFDLTIKRSDGSIVLRHDWSCGFTRGSLVCTSQTASSNNEMLGWYNATRYEMSLTLAAGEEVTVSIAANALTGLGNMLLGRGQVSLFANKGAVKTDVFAGNATPAKSHEWKFSTE